MRARQRLRFYNLHMSVFALGLNHTTAPVDLRGRFAFSPEQMCARRCTACASAWCAGAGEAGDRLHLQPHRALRRRPKKPTLLVRPAIDWLAGQGGVSGQTLLEPHSM